jgi:hypothetical protein
MAEPGRWVGPNAIARNAQLRSALDQPRLCVLDTCDTLEASQVERRRTYPDQRQVQERWLRRDFAPLDRGRPARCAAYTPGPIDPDQRTGAERWQWLS